MGTPNEGPGRGKPGERAPAATRSGLTVPRTVTPTSTSSTSAFAELLFRSQSTRAGNPTGYGFTFADARIDFSRGRIGRLVRTAVAVVAAAAAALGGAAGCSGGGGNGEGLRTVDAAEVVPAKFGARHRDGRIRVGYPDSWTESRSRRFGVVFTDNSSRHSGFVSVRYLPGRELPSARGFAAFAADVIRPGGRLLHLYTQAARIGGLGGIEAAFIWPLAGTRGPLLRAYGFDRGSHGVAFLVFASEHPRLHAADFAWVKRGIVWRREPARGRPVGGWYPRGY